jgi:hypothetical protein
VSTHAVPFARAVRLLVRTDLTLERRAPQLALAMGLFAAVAQVVLHYGADVTQPPVALTVGSLWVTLLLATRSCWRPSRARRSGPPRRSRSRRCCC